MHLDEPLGHLDAALGRAWRDETPYDLLRALCELDDRMAGHSGEARALDLVADAFRDAGVRDLERESFPLTTWLRGETTLRVTAPVDREFDALALPYSPSASVEGRLVDVGHGTHDEISDADLDGAIALARTDSPADGRFVHRMESFGHAVDAGADGFLFRNHVDGQLPPTGSLRFDEPARAPGVGVSKETGAWLGDYADRDATVALDVTATTRQGESEFLHGILGPEDADCEVVVLAHVDAHDVAEGALDNGCGVAVVAGVAGTLGRLDDAGDLDCRVRVAVVGAEEVGLRGSHHLAAALDLDTVHAVVNVDGAGRHRDMTAMTHGSDDLEGVLAAVADDVDHSLSTTADPHPWSDHWPFLRERVPAVQLYSDSGDRGRGWGHTAADTFDKTDSRVVREHAMLATLVILELAETDVDRVDETDLRDAMVAQGYDSGMQAAGIWPTDWTR
jgi:Zn-dependent M28 family amino/carboxypeptidase